MTRLEASEALPPYTYVPGGPWPHPRSAPQGHSYGLKEPKLAPVTEASGPALLRLLRGAELFNAGYYWEAHEVWEALWHAFGRRGPAADVVKALIKLAAAGVKVREGHEHGVRIHAARAASLLRAVSKQAGAHQLGLDLEECADRAQKVADDPPRDCGPEGAPVVRVFAFRIEIGHEQLSLPRAGRPGAPSAGDIAMPE
jgi:hypothetical protein